MKQRKLLLGSEEDAPLSIKKHKPEALGGTDSQRAPGKQDWRNPSEIALGFEQGIQKKRCLPNLF